MIPYPILLRTSVLYRMQSESMSGPCLDLERILNRFLSLTTLLIATSVCLVQRNPLSKYIPKCFASLVSGIFVPERNSSG